MKVHCGVDSLGPKWPVVPTARALSAREIDAIHKIRRPEWPAVLQPEDFREEKFRTIGRHVETSEASLFTRVLLDIDNEAADHRTRTFQDEFRELCPSPELEIGDYST